MVNNPWEGRENTQTRSASRVTGDGKKVEPTAKEGKTCNQWDERETRHQSLGQENMSQKPTTSGELF